MDKNINKRVIDTAFKDYSETIWVYLKKTNSKGANFDPYRQSGYTKTQQSPLPVKAIVYQTRENSLIFREIGLTETGTIEIIVKGNDKNLIKIAEKIVYEGEEYSVYNQKLGNKVQIFERPFNFYRITLFRKGN